MSKLLNGLSMLAIAGGFTTGALAVEAQDGQKPNANVENAANDKAKELAEMAKFSLRATVAKIKAAKGDNTPVTDVEVRAFIREKTPTTRPLTDAEADELGKTLEASIKLTARMMQNLTPEEFNELNETGKKLAELFKVLETDEASLGSALDTLAKMPKEDLAKINAAANKGTSGQVLPKTSVSSVVAPVAASVIAAVAGAAGLVARKRNA